MRCEECGYDSSVSLGETPPEWWSTQARRLAAIVGADTVVRLRIRSRGRDNIRIPRRPSTEHPWRAEMPAEAWTRVVNEFGGESFQISGASPTPPRKSEVLRLLSIVPPMSTVDIARAAGVGERYVRRIASAVD